MRHAERSNLDVILSTQTGNGIFRRFATSLNLQRIHVLITHSRSDLLGRTRDGRADRRLRVRRVRARFGTCVQARACSTRSFASRISVRMTENEAKLMLNAAR